MSSNDGATHFKLYQYTPNLVAAICALAAFGILTTIHIYKIARYRTLYFIPFVIGGVFETIGYGGRVWGHFDTTNIGGYIIQSLLILVAPALFAASIYMILGRLIRAVEADDLSVVPLRWLTKLFVLGDVFSFLLQLSGGGLQATGTQSMFNTGKNIILAGLFAQIVFFGLFVVTAIMFNVRARKNPRAAMANLPWQRHLNVLYSASTLILVRSIFRVIEYIQGNDGYLISHEIFLYIFDMLIMVSVMAVFVVWYVADIADVKKESERSSKVEYDSV